jgi:hypothetical protein
MLRQPWHAGKSTPAAQVEQALYPQQRLPTLATWTFDKSPVKRVIGRGYDAVQAVGQSPGRRLAAIGGLGAAGVGGALAMNRNTA